MTEREANLCADIRTALGLEISFLPDGHPSLPTTSIKLPKWPSKLDPIRTVVMDTSPTHDGEFWPTPRFEILIANLDSVGIAVVQVGDPSSERLARANHHFHKLSSAERAGVIDHALLWIGVNTPWRIIAAALSKPQVVIAASKDQLEPRWINTFVTDAQAYAPESKALGPISVTAVAEAVNQALKHIGASVSK